MPRETRSAVVEIRMCETCCGTLWPSLQAPAMREDVLIESVARKLEQCKRCKQQAPKLRAAAARSAERVFWAWVSG